MQNSVRPPAMTGPPPSGIRKFYVKFVSVGDRNEKYLCRVCKTVVSSSAAATSNLIKHIRKHHPTEFDAYQKEQLRRSTMTNSAPPSFASSSAAAHLESRPGDKRQRLIEETYDAHLQRLTRFLSSNLLSPSIVDSESFRNFTLGLDPRFLIPSAQQLNGVLLPQLYNGIKGRIKETLSHQNGLCVSIDVFCDKAEHYFMILTASFIKSSWEKESCLLCCRMFKNAPGKSFMLLVYENVIKDFGIEDKVEAIVIGRFRKQRNSQISLPGWELDHPEEPSLIPYEVFDITWEGYPLVTWSFEVLFLEVLQAGLLESAALEDLFSKVSRLATSLSAAAVGSHNDTNSGNINLQGSTWSKQFKLLKNYVEHFQEIRLYVTPNNLTISVEDLALVKEFVEVFESFDDAFERLQSTNETITCSQVIPIIRGLRHHLTCLVKTQLTEPIVACLSENLDEKMNLLENHEALHQASLMDPRFKTAWCTKTEQEQIKKKLEHTMIKYANKVNEENVVHRNESMLKRPKLFSFMKSEFTAPQRSRPSNCLQEQIEEEANRYLSSPCREHDLNPLNFWKGMEAEFPLIAKVARGSLCIEVASENVENLFVKSCSLRNGVTLSEEEFENLSFIRSNIDKFYE